MSEYILKVPEYESPYDPAVQSASLGEEIVRCRDCRWCMAYSKATYCDRFAHELPTVELDGFCAWGERRAG